MTADIRVCFVGDSFVNGTGDETALGWSGRLCAMAYTRGTPVTYYNLGIRRNTSADVLQRWEAECAARLPAGCDGRIALSCGVNDMAIENGSIRVSAVASRSNVADILRGANKFKRLMVGPPPVADDEQNDRIERLSREFAELCRALAVPYIDLFTPLAADASYIREIRNTDGAHPRSGGYEKMARIVSSSPDWWFR